MRHAILTAQLEVEAPGLIAARQRMKARQKGGAPPTPVRAPAAAW